MCVERLFSDLWFCSPLSSQLRLAGFYLQPQLLPQSLALRVTFRGPVSDSLSWSLLSFLNLVGPGASLGLVRLPLSGNNWLYD